MVAQAVRPALPARLGILGFSRVVGWLFPDQWRRNAQFSRTQPPHFGQKYRPNEPQRAPAGGDRKDPAPCINPHQQMAVKSI
jgi:hypothetical protein